METFQWLAVSLVKALTLVPVLVISPEPCTFSVT